MKTESNHLSDFNDIDLLYPSKYLKAADLRDQDVTITIESIEPRHELKGARGSEHKPVFRLKGTDKLLVCNKTNAGTIAELYGRKPADWVGKQITLYPTMVQVGGGTKPAIKFAPPSPRARQSRPSLSPNQNQPRAALARKWCTHESLPGLRRADRQRLRLLH